MSLMTKMYLNQIRLSWNFYHMLSMILGNCPAIFSFMTQNLRSNESFENGPLSIFLLLGPPLWMHGFGSSWKEKVAISLLYQWLKNWSWPVYFWYFFGLKTVIIWHFWYFLNRFGLRNFADNYFGTVLVLKQIKEYPKCILKKFWTYHFFRKNFVQLFVSANAAAQRFIHLRVQSHGRGFGTLGGNFFCSR